ncbi:hypothetical protein ACMFMG_010996 [Clarireedia jacksonii]
MWCTKSSNNGTAVSPDTKKINDELAHKKAKLLSMQRELTSRKKNIEDLTEKVKQMKSTLDHTNASLAVEKALLSSDHGKLDQLVEEIRTQTEAEEKFRKLYEKRYTQREQELIEENSKLTKDFSSCSTQLERVQESTSEQIACLTAELNELKRKHEQLKSEDMCIRELKEMVDALKYSQVGTNETSGCFEDEKARGWKSDDTRALFDGDAVKFPSSSIAEGSSNLKAIGEAMRNYFLDQHYRPNNFSNAKKRELFVAARLASPVADAMMYLKTASQDSPRIDEDTYEHLYYLNWSTVLQLAPSPTFIALLQAYANMRIWFPHNFSDTSFSELWSNLKVPRDGVTLAELNAWSWDNITSIAEVQKEYERVASLRLQKLEYTDKIHIVEERPDNKSWPDTGIMKRIPINPAYRDVLRGLPHELGLAVRARWFELRAGSDHDESAYRIWKGEEAIHHVDAVADALLYAPELFEDHHRFEARQDISLYKAIYGVRPQTVLRFGMKGFRFPIDLINWKAQVKQWHPNDYSSTAFYAAWPSVLSSCENFRQLEAEYQKIEKSWHGERLWQLYLEEEANQPDPEKWIVGY